MNSNSLLSRPAGDPERRPKDATPEMLTAAPFRSVGSAVKSLWVNWPRVSLTVREPIAQMLLTAIVWSVLSSPAEADGALNPPAPREFWLLTSYKL